ncbi:MULTISPECIES: acetyl-CoA carboxylase biotin carboxyl carrier protein [unclassified Staphylococcus]|uniref:acetyl-CoA carboxylase biotin carboxyl carrier protein n=1 Tax=unclassified Staphylococcus TaxID=91994 RepID=UPI0021CF5FDF|nr:MULTISPECIES: acetyl-CoA carboxylase biotin carboxyl carrier protein [unclassified Staphylococcus]UXR68689.1 acetyl-CoA carboxylase biotin carboxyl carrier protein [Staphylococcus sp. IVB6246]UXR70746.1 acetyl-CoA carboxylase biotin carboxyl carrier protein [Staphylococcus sp. IVB6240]UXR72977.1 acetyl-CoA carboxylase biotin carboxyl carrier protein [Staphylococcus sp. IVB6238]UXR75272.1 acetyl-CoA carboxylase biotin carboxyl carrier protein [Staphylococcus sp. IVB6233]UXR79473.1 acetyl-CoA
MNFNEIKELIEMLDQSSLTEIKIENKESKISLKKEKITQHVTAASVPNVAQINPEPVSVESAEPVITEDTSDLKTINAPMVGTFYKAPSPEESPYVQIGDQVSPETTVCILEAMKLFNEIQAEVTGEIVEVLVEDGQMVEYGQALFKVK